MSLLKQILVPTDFSQNSTHAINYACDLALQTTARLHLVHVTRDDAKRHEPVNQRLEHIAAMMDARVQLPHNSIRTVIEGDSAKSIAEYAHAHEIDLIVMSTHGRTGLAHLTMGSVTERVIREVACPVLVLGPHDGEHVTLNQAAQVLSRLIGNGLTEKIESGRATLLKALVSELRIPSTTAILLFDELENREWLRYENEQWLVSEGAELLDESKVFEPDFTSDSPAIDLIKRAKSLRATDVHIDPTENEQHRVRFRVDGRLREYCRLHDELAKHMINRFKTMAGLNTADPFHPLEAGLRLPQKFAGLDIRLTTIPVAGGQAVALRLFDADKISLPLIHLGLTDQALASVQQILQCGEGLVLVTGPTGSGKTTTVYSMLQSLGGDQQNIVSIEDPVEFAVPYIRQMNVDVKHGVSMTEGLKTILRMDPDVVFVGEIRDLETAAIGMRAASSGKYVFSTMHTRDVVSTIMTLNDLGIDRRSIASNVSGIVNQRLVRKLCQDCRIAGELSVDERSRFEAVGLVAPDVLFQPVGCLACNSTGFQGRIGVFEVAAMNADIRTAISQQEPAIEIEKHIRASGSASLEVDALSKAATGDISFDEAIGIRWLA